MFRSFTEVVMAARSQAKRKAGEWNGSRGGALAIIRREECTVCKLGGGRQYKSFEHLDVKHCDAMWTY